MAPHLLCVLCVLLQLPADATEVPLEYVKAVSEVLKGSELLELDETGTKVRTRQPHSAVVAARIQHPALTNAPH